MPAAEMREVERTQPHFDIRTVEPDTDSGWLGCPTSCTSAQNVVEPITTTINPNNTLTKALSEGANLDVVGMSRNVSSTSLAFEPNKLVIDGITVVHKDDVGPDAPLIILTGWAGCNDKNLAKYSQFYTEEGFMVARYTVPINQVVTFSSYQRFALKLYENVFQLEKCANRPIFIHNFSMNGCSLLAMLWRLLGEVSDGQDIKSRVKGLVFDSSPANVMPWHIADALTITQRNMLVRHSVRLITVATLSVHRLGVWATSKLYPNIYNSQFAYHMLLSFHDLPQQQLYLYSECDTICIPSSIREFQAIQKARNAHVTETCWPMSGHCRHLVPHKEEYVKACVHFVTSLLPPHE